MAASPSPTDLSRPWLVAAAPLVAAHLGLLALGDPAARPALTYLALGTGFAGLWWACHRAAAGPAVSPAAVLAIAVVLRALLLPLPPTLSDDALRYAWDGRVAAAGHDPYALAPDAPALEGLRDADWARLPHRDVPTVYPPAAMGLFALAARVPAPRLSLKIALTVCDLVTCWLLLALARRLRVGAGRVVAYAWNPLVTLEVAGMGHVDALGVMAVAGAVWALSGRRAGSVAAGIWAAAGVLAKLVPVVAIPLWARLSRRPGRFLLVVTALCVAALAPVAVSVGGVPPGLVTYARSWEFNGPLYEPLWRLIDAVGADDAVKGGLDVFKGATGGARWWNRLYPLSYPQALARVPLAAALIGLLVYTARRREPDPVGGTGLVLGGAILMSPTVYPWYLLWVLPWAALCRQRAWLGLAALAPLAYLPALTGTPHVPWVFAAIWVPFAVMLVVEPRWSSP